MRAPPPSFLLTFDDGYRGYAELVRRLAELDIRPLTYITSGALGTNARFWWLAGPERREIARLKAMATRDRLRHLAERHGWTPERDYGSPIALSEAGLAAVADAAIIGAHTITHPILSRCTDAEARTEIVDGVDDLEGRIRRPIAHFAYPNGGAGDFGEREVAMLRHRGIRFARTTSHGWVDVEDTALDNHRLPGVLISDTASVDELIARLAGVRTWLKRLPGLRARASGVPVTSGR